MTKIKYNMILLLICLCSIRLNASWKKGEEPDHIRREGGGSMIPVSRRRPPEQQLLTREEVRDARDAEDCKAVGCCMLGGVCACGSGVSALLYCSVPAALFGAGTLASCAAGLAIACTEVEGEAVLRKDRRS